MKLIRFVTPVKTGYCSRCRNVDNLYKIWPRSNSKNHDLQCPSCIGRRLGAKIERREVAV